MNYPLAFRPEIPDDIAEACRWYEGRRTGLSRKFLRDHLLGVIESRSKRRGADYEAPDAGNGHRDLVKLDPSHLAQPADETVLGDRLRLEGVGSRLFAQAVPW